MFPSDPVDLVEVSWNVNVLPGWTVSTALRPGRKRTKVDGAEEV